MSMLLKTPAKNLVGLWKKDISNLSEIETFCAFPYTTSCTVIKKNFILPISLYVPVISGYINEKKKKITIWQHCKIKDQLGII